MSQPQRSEPAPAPIFVYARQAMLAIICASVVLLFLEAAQKYLLIGELTRSVSRATVWGVLVCFVAYLTVKSRVSTGVRRTLLVPLTGLVFILASDMTEDVTAWNDTPIVGRHSQVRRALDNVATVVFACGVILALYQLLRSIDASHRKYQVHFDELAQASRVSTMNELTAGIAHELNQPLAAIATYAHLANARLHGNSVDQIQYATELLGKIEAQAYRAGDIIKRLRQLVTKNELTLDVVDFNDVVREAIEMCSARAAELRQRIDICLALGLPPVHADVVQVRQSVVNLVVNALEANAAGNQRDNAVTVATSLRGDQQVCVTVSDNGPGLPADLPSKVFEPFYSTKSYGMGIGLAICKSISEAHGGKISARNNPGRGATFTLQLPVGGPSACDVPEPAIAAPDRLIA
ncbi:MAG: ATP-binding protein [Pirellulales bacterium]